MRSHTRISSLSAQNSFDSGSGPVGFWCCALYASMTTSLIFLGVSSTFPARKRQVVAMRKRS